MEARKQKFAHVLNPHTFLAPFFLLWASRLSNVTCQGRVRLTQKRRISTANKQTKVQVQVQGRGRAMIRKAGKADVEVHEHVEAGSPLLGP
jgi:hypothetical protein